MTITLNDFEKLMVYCKKIKETVSVVDNCAYCQHKNFFGLKIDNEGIRIIRFECNHAKDIRKEE